MKLTPEQIEDILSGQTPQGDNLDADDLAALEEARAMRARLTAAFESIHAGESLADKIKTSLQASAPAPRRRTLRFPMRLIPLAAAAVLLIAFVVFQNVFTPEPAQAGTVELANIHKANLSSSGGFRATGDCEDIKAYFKRELGFTPKLLNQCPRLKVVGCHVAKVQGQMVATYVVQLDKARASVIVTEDWPKKLGLGCGCGHPHCKCIHNGQCGDLTILSVRVGDRSYSVVGKLPPEELRFVLERLGG
ncbi:MAG: hypothetical protein HN350_02625 [Phycisphaerales bacterium]|jgi:hypothetical protein|nr:hypothetical protein [Phycisphaerales bacterium]